MKTYTINIHPELKDVTFSVKNGKAFEKALIAGDWKTFEIQVSESDLKRVKQFAVRYGNDKSSNRGNWYAHCNGYAMDLIVAIAGQRISINTYRPYGGYGCRQQFEKDFIDCTIQKETYNEIRSLGFVI